MYGLCVAVLYTLRLYDAAHRHIDLIRPISNPNMSQSSARRHLLPSNSTHAPHNKGVSLDEFSINGTHHHSTTTHNSSSIGINHNHKSYHALIREVEIILVHSAGRDEDMLVRHLPTWIRALNTTSHIDFPDRLHSAIISHSNSTVNQSSQNLYNSSSTEPTALSVRNTTRRMKHTPKDTSKDASSHCRSYDIPLTLLPQLLPANITLFKHHPPQLPASSLRMYKFPQSATNRTSAGNRTSTSTSASADTGAVSMPRLGFGMKSLGLDGAEKIILEAINLGFRRFETSQFFGECLYNKRDQMY